jgi:hypothetical protein
MTDDLVYAMNELNFNSLSDSSPFFVTHFPLFQFKYEKTLQDNFKALAKSNIWNYRHSNKMYDSIVSDERHIIAEWRSICFVQIFEDCMKQKQRSWRIGSGSVEI